MLKKNHGDFSLIADCHNAEKYVQLKHHPSWLAKAIQTDRETLKHINAHYGGELIVMPDDSNGGHWDRKKFIQPYNPG